MSTVPSLPSYDEITEAVKESTGKFNASQVHGLLCGLICATSGNPDAQWENILFGKKKSEKSKEILQQLYEASYHQVSEFSFEFDLLLPDDEVDINTRAEALGLWCQGFITGLEKAKVPIQNREPGEVTEALNDIIEISQVNYGDIAENDEDETAYFELVEYVRLAVLMLFHELKSNDSQTDFSENDSPH